MANPLIASAAEVDSRVEPATKFFDPAASVGIMERYGMSGQSRAFAEDALKSANEIDKASNYDPQNRRNDLETHEWNRKVQGRADVEYGRKKEQEDAFGAFAKEIYGLNFDTDPEAENKLGAMASNPLLADYEPARAILNHRFGEVEVRRKAADQDNDYEKRLADELGSNGFTVVRGDDGKIDRTKTFGQVREDKIGAAKAKDAEKVRGETLEEIGKDNAILLDQSYEYVTQSRSSRAKGTVDAAAAQKVPLFKSTDKDITSLLDATPDMPKDAFIAQVVDLGKSIPIPEGADPMTAYLAALNNKAELPPALKPLVQSLEDTWAAHRVMLRKAPPKKADAPAAAGAPPAPVDTDASDYAKKNKPTK
jgi:hypothetical protein